MQRRWPLLSSRRRAPLAGALLVLRASGWKLAHARCTGQTASCGGARGHLSVCGGDASTGWWRRKHRISHKTGRRHPSKFSYDSSFS